MTEKGDISKIFLESFFKTLLLEIASKENIVERKKIEKIKSKIDVYESRNDIYPSDDQIPTPRPPVNREMIKSVMANPMQNNFDNNGFIPSIVPQSPRPPAPRPIAPQVMPSPAPQQIPMQVRPKAPPAQIPRPSVMPPKKREMTTITNPGRPISIQNNSPIKTDFTPSIGISVVNEELTGVPSIDKILQDNDVKTVECPGPNKQVLVYKGGKIQAANLTLTADEINNIMNNFSKKARIPIGNGFFKAAIDKYLITSVMSEFVGTRFIIQRKPQVQNPQLR